jgi:hypothetical protein
VTKFIQGLVIIILVGFAAQVVLRAVEPFIPAAVAVLIVVIIVGRWARKKRDHW